MLALAEHWPLEAIHVDSATIYRGMDIGTAKPTLQEQAQVPQHLLDIRDPAQSYSVAEFRRDAKRLIRQIRARGHIPLLVGGTMLYFKALYTGLDDLPAANPTLRASLNTRAAQIGWPAMHAQLATVDPIIAARLAPNDSQRIQRAWEVFLITGRPMSSQLRRTITPPSSDEIKPEIPAPQEIEPEKTSPPGIEAEKYASSSIDLETFPSPTIESAPLHTITVSLEPSDRLSLHTRIARRFDAMLAQGLLQEVEALYARGDLHPGLPSIRCVGYKQLWAYLKGEITFAQACTQALAATRQLAKRQLTWLRAQPERVVIDCLDPNAITQIIQAYKNRD